jgi:hypothetical protein
LHRYQAKEAVRMSCSEARWHRGKVTPLTEKSQGRFDFYFAFIKEEKSGKDDANEEGKTIDDTGPYNCAPEGDGSHESADGAPSD